MQCNAKPKPAIRCPTGWLGWLAGLPACCSAVKRAAGSGKQEAAANDDDNNDKQAIKRPTVDEIDARKNRARLQCETDTDRWMRQRSKLPYITDHSGQVDGSF